MKPVIYQILPRLFTNRTAQCVPNGDISQNGCGKFNEINTSILKKIKELGATHVWYTGIIEHATATDYSAYGIQHDNHHVVKGKAGSPYAIKDYYDVDPDLAVKPENRMEEFEALLKRTHRNGLKVIIDFVPNHVARQYHSDVKPVGIEDLGVNDDSSLYFGRDNNFYYIPRQLFAPSFSLGEGSDAYIEFPAKASGNDAFTAFPGPYDWYETVKLNYGVDYGDGSRHFDPIPNTWLKMLHILRFWAAKGIDGFRCDMVHMVPVEFWRWALPQVKQHYPNIKFIGEIYDTALYPSFLHAGFDYLYDKVTLYDTLRNIQCFNHSAAQLTNCWQTVEGMSDKMLNFLENHDEQRFGSRQYAGDPSKALASLAISALINRGPMMIYMAQEIGETGSDAEGFSGEDGRTTIFDYWSLPTMRRWLDENGRPDDSRLSQQQKWLRNAYAAILNLCNSEKAVSMGGFFDLMYVNYDHPISFNPHRHYAFLRNFEGETLLVVANFSNSRAHVEVNIPRHAFETLGIEEYSQVSMTELLSDKTEIRDFNSDKPFATDVDAYGAVVWKISAPKGEKKLPNGSRKETKKS